MARSRETKIELTAYDDLFQTDESREEAKLSKIRDIPISEINEFPDHPFKVLMDEDMEQLVESIKRNGVMTPATVRLKEDGRYELISGHRRKKACELAGLETLKCEVKELTRDEAIIVMVESNLQRSVTSFYNERQRVEIDLIKSLAIDEAYGIGKNGEIFDVTFGLYAAEELTAADGKTIPADGLIEVISLDESGHGKAISDLPMGSYYVQEISTNSAYIVSDAKYPVTFEYAGQDTETVRITAMRAKLSQMTLFTAL